MHDALSEGLACGSDEKNDARPKWAIEAGLHEVGTCSPGGGVAAPRAPPCQNGNAREMFSRAGLAAPPGTPPLKK